MTPSCGWMRSRDGKSRHPLMHAFVVLTAVAVAGCGAPDFVEDRVQLDSCSPDEPVYVPVAQGPDAAEPRSQTALDCFVSAADDGRDVEFAFLLMGAEGERYEAVLQTMSDGSVNYYRETDHGWIGYETCETLEWPEPGVPTVADCVIEHGQIDE